MHEKKHPQLNKEVYRRYEGLSVWVALCVLGRWVLLTLFLREGGVPACGEMKNLNRIYKNKSFIKIL